jgi:plasmid stabilization system protein ParE
MQVSFSKSFHSDLEQIENYLKDKTSLGFISIKINLYSTLQNIIAFPLIGIRTDRKEYYVFPVHKYEYKIVYKVLQNEIRFMRLIHNKRNTKI